MDDLEFKISTHAENDADMENAEPKRKMFSSTPVGEQQHTDDVKDGGMKTVKAVGKAVKAPTGTLKSFK